MRDERVEHQNDLMPRHVVCLALAAVVLVILGLYLGGFDLESWARERSKPSPHYLGPPKIERPSNPSPLD